MTSKCVFMRRSILNPGTDVKSSEPVSRETGKILFTYAEIAKDRIENLLDVNAPRETANVKDRSPQSLGHEFQMIGGERRCAQKVFDTGSRYLLATGPNQSRRLATRGH